MQEISGQAPGREGRNRTAKTGRRSPFRGEINVPGKLREERVGIGQRKPESEARFAEIAEQPPHSGEARRNRPAKNPQAPDRADQSRRRPYGKQEAPDRNEILHENDAEKVATRTGAAPHGRRALCGRRDETVPSERKALRVPFRRITAAVHGARNEADGIGRTDRLRERQNENPVHPHISKTDTTAQKAECPRRNRPAKNPQAPDRADQSRRRPCGKQEGNGAPNRHSGCGTRRIRHEPPRQSRRSTPQTR